MNSIIISLHHQLPCGHRLLDSLPKTATARVYGLLLAHALQIGVMMNLQLVGALREGRGRVLAPFRDNAPLHPGLRGEGVVA